MRILSKLSKDQRSSEEIAEKSVPAVFENLKSCGRRERSPARPASHMMTADGGASLAGSRVRIKCAGGCHGRFVLVAQYAPRKGIKKLIQSNHTAYGKSWASSKEIEDSDKAAFLQWINTELAHGGGSKRRASVTSLPLASRSSVRLDECLMHSTVPIATDQAELQIEAGVLQCMKFLVENVVFRARHDEELRDKTRTKVIHRVPGKRGHAKTRMTTPGISLQRFASRCITKRYRLQAKLSQRRSRGHHYRKGILKRAATAKAEEDLEWLMFHKHRLATVVARQSLHDLLPEGEPSENQTAPSGSMPCGAMSA